MELRTFFWHDRVISQFEMNLRKKLNFSPSRYFQNGNSGDIFSKEVLKETYNIGCRNIKSSGNRFLCIGSIATEVKDGDVISGIGFKGDGRNIPFRKNCKIYGVRGPITYAEFKKSGYDMKEVSFQLDPGLLIRFMKKDIKYTREQVSFIPHYRERFLKKNKTPKSMKFVDIDNEASVLVEEILKSKIVYTSSLHGIIFCHALNVPCIFVKPKTEEPLLKFQDYFASIDIKYPKPLSDISEYDFKKDSDTPVGISYDLSDFKFPSLDDLIKKGVVDY